MPIYFLGMPIYFLGIEFVSFIDFLLGLIGFLRWENIQCGPLMWFWGANNPLGFREDNNSLKGK